MRTLVALLIMTSAATAAMILTPEMYVTKRVQASQDCSVQVFGPWMKMSPFDPARPTNEQAQAAVAACVDAKMADYVNGGAGH